MKKIAFYIIFFFLVANLPGCLRQKNVLPDLREKYSYTDAKPFGSHAAHSMVEAVFDGKDIQKTNTTFSKKFSENEDTGSIYFSISRSYLPEEKDINALLNYIDRGNTAFIAASSIDVDLLDKMLCSQVNFSWQAGLGSSSLQHTSVRLIADATTEKDSFYYFYFPFANYFSQINNTDCRIVGYNQDDKPNLLVFFWGKGRLYLHADPRAFSNYFLLSRNNLLYMKQVLQFLPPNPARVYWDNYYNRVNSRQGTARSFSGLKAILDNPPLTAALLIATALLFLFIFFNSKRRQRTIPVIRPVENSTIAFAQAIAGLYLQEKNNKTIADKMITYFNEHIRTRYFLNTALTNQEFIEALSRKSGVPLDKTASLYHAISDAITTDDMDDYQLLSLNEQIQQFYKNRN